MLDPHIYLNWIILFVLFKKLHTFVSKSHFLCLLLWNLNLSVFEVFVVFLVWLVLNCKGYVRPHEVFIHLPGDLILRLTVHFSDFPTYFIQPCFPLTAGPAVLFISRRIMNSQFGLFSLSPSIIYFCWSSLLESQSDTGGARCRPVHPYLLLVGFLRAQLFISLPGRLLLLPHLIICLVSTRGLVSRWSFQTQTTCRADW